MAKKSNKSKMEWNLGQLYKSPNDPNIEKDILEIEKIHADFAKRFDTTDKKYLTDRQELLRALQEYEVMETKLSQTKPLLYFFSQRDIDSANSVVTSKLNLISNRYDNSANKVLFFKISLGKIDAKIQGELLEDKNFAKYHYFLSKIFALAKHTLSTSEEKIINLKNLPSHDMWVEMNKKALNRATVKWQNKIIPLSQASGMVKTLTKASDRAKLSTAISLARKEVAKFAESEINAVITNKKIEDELRGFAHPYDATVMDYENKPETVTKLVEVVSGSYKISQDFYKLKARLLKMKKLNYWDRSANYGKIIKKFSFDESVEMLKKIFGELNPLYSETLDRYVKNGQIDVYSRLGKVGGAYCRGMYIEPTYILLNHIDDFYSFSTLAHEMGHAYHTILARKQDKLNFNYSFALAETASTLFETIAFDAVFDTLSPKEQVFALHDRLDRDMATIFRQIACFEYELDIHKSIRSKGYLSKEELALMHNKHMSKYLGSAVKILPDDGYMFVDWSHIRRFFYVYSYAFGLLVSKALLRRYNADKNYWTQIEKFLSAGGKDSPENILLEIGVDITKPEFWKEGINEIKEQIEVLKKLVK